MSRNHDTTDSAVKSSCQSTLESDCCAPSRFVDCIGGGRVTCSKQRAHCAFEPIALAKDEEAFDSGVALSCSKSIDEKTIEQCRIKEDPAQQLKEIQRIEERLANLHVGLDDGRTGREPEEIEHILKNAAAEEDLFDWDLVFEQDQDGDTQLHIAVMLDGQLDFALSVINLCIATQFLDLQNDLLQTALHLAVIMRRTRVIQALVSRGAAVFMCDLNGNTPLHLACQMGYTEAVQVLTQKYQKQSEKLALQRIIHHRNYEGLTCCHLSAKSLAPDNLFHLIQDCGADINIQEGKRGMTVLHMAAESNNLILVTFLVECPGINLNQSTYDGWTALDLAMGRCLKEMENELHKAGAWHNEETDTSSSESQSDEEIFEEDTDKLEIFQYM